MTRYSSSMLRHPTHALVRADPEEIERRSPAFGHSNVDPLESDLTKQHAEEPLGQRITVSGRVLDGEGRSVRGQLIEVWQANASGRYADKRDQHPAPLDPNFTGSVGPSPIRTANTCFGRSSRPHPAGATTSTAGDPRTSTSPSSGLRSRSG